MTLLVIGLAGAALAIITWLLVPKELLAPPSESEPQLSPSQVVTLYRLFKEDVPGVKSIGLHASESSCGAVWCNVWRGATISR